MAFEGKKQSLFDALEDSGYAECLAKAQAIAGVSGAILEGRNCARKSQPGAQPAISADQKVGCRPPCGCRSSLLYMALTLCRAR